MLQDLQQIVQKVYANPEVLKTGIKVGPYSISLGKVWRGNTVIGYAATEPLEGEKPTFMHTSQTTPEEAATFREPAPETPAATPPMQVNSPEGKEAEEPSEPGKAAGKPQQVSPSGEPSPNGETPPKSEKGYRPPPKRKNPRDLLAQSGSIIYPEEYMALNESRLIETRRKYIRASALVEFDIESKQITGGEWIHLYLLPANRPEGKYELYDFCVTKTSGIPHSQKVIREVAAAVRDACPHIVVNANQLRHLGQRMYKIIRAAKEVLGGPNVGENLNSEIELYLQG
jgi:hypothetical protein